jgi:hypothetical protein
MIIIGNLLTIIINTQKDHSIVISNPTLSLPAKAKRSEDWWKGENTINVMLRKAQHEVETARKPYVQITDVGSEPR